MKSNSNQKLYTGIFLILVCAILLSNLFTGKVKESGGQIRSITLTTSGVYHEKPSKVSYMVTLTVDGSSNEEANSKLALLSESSKKIIKKYNDIKIESDSLNVNPVYDYTDSSNPSIKGFQASEFLNITIPYNSEPGKLLGELSSLSNSISLAPGATSMEDSNVSYIKASKIAIELSRDRAENYAKNSGLKLGKIISIKEDTQSHTIYPMANDGVMAKGATSSVSLDQGEGSTTVTVTITWEVK